MEKVAHFEIPAKNKKQSQEFYEAMFGWKLQDVPMSMGGATATYTTATTTETDPQTMTPTEPGGINGAIIDESSEIKAPVITINVDSIDDHLEKVEEKGGKVIEEKQAVEGMGFYAYVEDPSGNVIGLWEDAKK